MTQVTKGRRGSGDDKEPGGQVSAGEHWIEESLMTAHLLVVMCRQRARLVR